MRLECFKNQENNSTIRVGLVFGLIRAVLNYGVWLDYLFLHKNRLKIRPFRWVNFQSEMLMQKAISRRGLAQFASLPGGEPKPGSAGRGRFRILTRARIRA